ncbi:MAG: RsbRD N-terminal domain-containing protein [Deltaproteobacteria bacterium]|nr:RsbRD N-terminal domain-containing protein [Deltaproteobacteria bacterium]
MKLLSLLAERKASLTDRWLQRLFESYPPETIVFLKKEKDRFDNPVRHQTAEGLNRIVDALVQEMGRDQIMAALDEVIRVRALQNFSPSQALAFIFLLKNVIREEVAEDLKDGQFSQELQELDATIDGIVLLGFEVYMQRREKLYEIRVTEVKQRVSGFLRSKGMDVNGF